MRWNGDDVAVDRDLPPTWAPVAFDVPADRMKVGMNIVELDAPVGTAVGKMELSFLP